MILFKKNEPGTISYFIKNKQLGINPFFTYINIAHTLASNFLRLRVFSKIFLTTNRLGTPYKYILLYFSLAQENPALMIRVKCYFNYDSRSPFDK